MLVLSRKLGQSFRLGPDVRVTIVKIDRNSVRIGIEAPERDARSSAKRSSSSCPNRYAIKTEAA